MFSTNLPDDIKSEWDSMSSRITNPNDFARNYVEAQRTISRSVRVPGADAKPEDWDKVYNAFGRPTDPKEYHFTDPEAFELTDDDKQFRESFRPVAHQAGLNQKQLAALEQWQYETSKAQLDANIAKANSIARTNEQALKSELGPDYDTTI